MGKIDLQTAIWPKADALPLVQGYAAFAAKARARNASDGGKTAAQEMTAVAYLVCLWAGADRLAGLFAARLDASRHPMSQRIAQALDGLVAASGPYGDLPFASEPVPDFAAHLRAQDVPDHVSAALAYGLAILKGRAASASGFYAQADDLDHIIAYAQRLILLGPARAQHSLH